MKCCGVHEHIPLQGNAFCGKSRTAVANRYWPGFANEWVDVWKCLYSPAEDGRHPPLHLAGYGSAPLDVPVGTLLKEMHFVQPRGQELSSTATRVGAGLQPTGRSMPQLLPDGLGLIDHLKLAQCPPIFASVFRPSRSCAAQPCISNRR